MQFIRKMKIVLISVLLAALLFTSISGVIAYIQEKTNLSNVFSVGKLNAEVVETFANNQKTNVSVKNSGNTEAYVRVALIFQWKDAAGNILAGTPQQGTDYTLQFAIDTNWMRGEDGYYYYIRPVAENTSTTDLIKSCEVTETSTTEKYVSLDVVTQLVQAFPAEAVEDAWNATVENGVLVPPAKGGTGT